LLIFDPFSQKYTQKSQKPLKTRKNVVFDPKSRGYSEKPQILRQKLKGFGGGLGGGTGVQFWAFLSIIMRIFVFFKKALFSAPVLRFPPKIHAGFCILQKTCVSRPRFETSPQSSCGFSSKDPQKESKKEVKKGRFLVFLAVLGLIGVARRVEKGSFLRVFRGFWGFWPKGPQKRCQKRVKKGSFLRVFDDFDVFWPPKKTPLFPPFPPKIHAGFLRFKIHPLAKKHENLDSFFCDIFAKKRHFRLFLPQKVSKKGHFEGAFKAILRGFRGF
jgi:hypothetical protein